MQAPKKRALCVVLFIIVLNLFIAIYLFRTPATCKKQKHPSVIEHVGSPYEFVLTPQTKLNSPPSLPKLLLFSFPLILILSSIVVYVVVVPRESWPIYNLEARTKLLGFSKVLGIILACVIGLSLLLFPGIYILQNKFLYFPTKGMLKNPGHYSMPYESVRLTAADGTKLQSFYIPAKKDSCPIIIFCQGNGGNVVGRLEFAQTIRERTDCGFLLPSYRGYGESEGSPVEAGIRMDLQANLDWLLAKVGSARPLIAMGESMGGGVATDLVHRNIDKFKGLVLQNTFLSLDLLIPEIVPIFRPFLFLLRNNWTNSAKINRQMENIKMLFLVGLRDALIPPGHCQTLYSLAINSGCRAKLVEFADGGHNDLCDQPGYYDQLCSYIVDEF